MEKIIIVEEYILCIVISAFPLWMIYEGIKTFLETQREEQDKKEYSIESITTENEYERN